jgi:prepilin-type processing-associated H-X9-DG protein/prepilin-type N-terminal cleavage/methylation domain-containing protein
MRSLKLKKTNVFKTAFTLVELLVVISIIALLLAILMPSLQKARSHAVTIICKTRLKDISTAVGLYILDNNNELPSCTKWDAVSNGWVRGYRWMNKIGRYQGRKTSGTEKELGGLAGVDSFELYRCPTQDKFTGLAKQEAQSDVVGDDITTTGSIAIYGYNEYFSNIEAEYLNMPLGAKSRFNWRKVGSILQPGTLPLFADFDGSDPVNNQPTSRYGWLLNVTGPHPTAITKYHFDNGNLRKNHWSYNGPAPNHNGKCNYLMADGHTESLGLWPWKDFIGTDFHPRRNVTVWPF